MTDNVAWEQTLDAGRFRARVIQTEDGYSGRLVVTVVETNDVLLDEPVGIAYAARFGPDAEDVGVWQARTISVVDDWLRENGEEVPDAD